MRDSTGTIRSLFPGAALLFIILLVTTASAQVVDAPEAETKATLDRLGIDLPFEVTSRYRIAIKIDQLQREPCDQKAIFEPRKELEIAGYRREASNALLSFAEHCGGNVTALRAAANVLLDISDYAKVIEVANMIIKVEPYGDNAYYLRARAHEGLKNHENVIADYITTIELFGDKQYISRGVYFRTSDAYAALGRYCDALMPVEAWIALNPSRNDTSQTRAMISDLSEKGKCATQMSGSEETIAIAGGTKVITVDASVNGVRGRFLLDTGATFLSLRKSFATLAKVSMQDDDAIQLHTANGFAKATLGRADAVKLGKIQARNVAVAVQADSDGLYGRGIGGLLGMSFLSRFDIRMDARSVRIRPRTETGGLAGSVTGQNNR